jgi:hypothetical protein
MITIAPGYQTGDRWFPTIQEAQKSELAALFRPWTQSDTDDFPTAAAAKVVEHADEIVAILTCQPKSKAPRKLRSDIGKKRASRVEIANQT